MNDPLYVAYMHHVMDIVCTRFAGYWWDGSADLVDMWIVWNFEMGRSPQQAAEYVVDSMALVHHYDGWTRGR